MFLFLFHFIYAVRAGAGVAARKASDRILMFAKGKGDRWSCSDLQTGRWLLEAGFKPE